jgi:hypothetical protein
MLNPKKVVQTFFDYGLVQNTRFCDKKCAVFGSKIALWLKMRAKVQFPTKNSTFFVSKTCFLKKAMIKKCFDHFLGIPHTFLC